MGIIYDMRTAVGEPIAASAIIISQADFEVPDAVARFVPAILQLKDAMLVKRRGNAGVLSALKRISHRYYS